MILEYLKHLKRKWYIFLFSGTCDRRSSLFRTVFIYTTKEKGGAGKSIEVDVYRLLNIDVASLESTKTGETLDYDMSLLWTRSYIVWSELCGILITENYEYGTRFWSPEWGNMALESIR